MTVNAARAKSLFLNASDLADPAARSAFLDRECGGDAELRGRVEALLRANDEAPLPSPELADGTSDHLSNSPGPTQDFAESAAGVGSILAGRYKLIEEIGEGGMGAVYMAQQTEPVRRAVAVKVIKAGMDSKAVLARFEAERQALAMMDHPNIAKVLDAGATEGGRPFFVMELVKGQPITQYCDERKLTPRQRLELFLPVCQAIQHAHQKGIIHRDIKPSNVLVAMYDDRPVPKVIDFGVAKAAGGALTDKTLMTGFGAVVGTAEYMSPEQANLNNIDIDTRSDVYSLGVLLYELLTGTTPVDRKSLGKAALLEILRIVREVEAPRPSAKLSTIDTLPSVAANRGTEPAKLSKMMQGELDWVVLKALEKDRTRRYDTANGLARDIQRYLSDEVVEARPPSTGYRLKKFVRRNKAKVVAASLVLMALVAGMAGTMFGLIRAEQALSKEAAQRVIANAQRVQAEKARDRTREVLDAMTSSATGHSLSRQSEISEDQKKFLTEVLTYYREFAGEEADDEQSRARTAQAALRVGRIEYRLGHIPQSVAAHEMARDGFQKLGTDFPDVPDYRERLATCLTNLGTLLSDVGQHAAAEEQYRRGLAINEKLVADFPAKPELQVELSSSRYNLGVFLSSLGKRTEAEEQHRKALANLEQLVANSPSIPAYRQELAMVLNSLGIQQAELGRQSMALDKFRQAQTILEALVADFPGAADYRQRLAESHNNLALLLAGQGNKSEAEAQYHKALAITKELATYFPGIPALKLDLATSHCHLGSLLADSSKPKEAEEQYRSAMSIQMMLVADFPAVFEYQTSLGGTYCNLGLLLRDDGRTGDSLEWFDKAAATLTSIHRAEPRDIQAKRFLCNSHRGRALAYSQLKRHDQAARDWQAVVELEAPDQLGVAHFQHGVALDRAGDAKAAELAFKRGLELREEAIQAAGPDDRESRWLLLLYLIDRGRHEMEMKRHDVAVEWFTRAVPACASFVERWPSSDATDQFRWAHQNRAECFVVLGRFEEAAKDWDRAVELCPEEDRPMVRARRAQSRLYAGKVEDALSEADALNQQPGLAADQQYQVACVYAIASGRIADKQQEYSDRAMELLRRAVTAGYKDAANMKQDKDLDALRAREDFQKLMAELDAKVDVE